MKRHPCQMHDLCSECLETIKEAEEPMKTNRLTNAEGRELLNKTRKKPGNEESQIQSAFVSWFRDRYPQYHYLLTAIPNGGNRSPVTGAILKREGVIPGYPDMLLAVPRSPFNGLFLEFKKPDGKVSANQKHIITQLEQQMYSVAVVYSVAEAQAVINWYFEGE